MAETATTSNSVVLTFVEPEPEWMIEAGGQRAYFPTREAAQAFLDALTDNIVRQKWMGW